MNKSISLPIALLLAGCYATTPTKDLTADETTALLNSMSGKYKATDSRSNPQPRIAGIDVKLSTKRGMLDVTTESGGTYRLKLLNCELANNAQANNFGKPFDSIEALVRCDILSEYKYAQLYIGKVKPDYVVSDRALLKNFEPMTITSGHVISIKQNIGSDVLLNAIKE